MCIISACKILLQLALVDPYTNLITDNILMVLDYLFYNFGKVSLEEVLEKESKIITMT